MRKSIAALLPFLFLFKITSAHFNNDTLDTIQSNSRIHKFAIGTVISPAYNYRKLENLIDPKPYWPPDFADSINGVEQPKLVFNFGITFSILLREHFTLITGLNY